MSAIIQSEMPETSHTEVPETTPKELSEHTYKFEIIMSCSGCSGAVERVLGKLAGVKSYDVNRGARDVGTALVTAEPSLDYDTVYEKIKKTGKHIKSGEADGVKTEYGDDGKPELPKKDDSVVEIGSEKLPEPKKDDSVVEIGSEKLPEPIAA